MTNKIPCYIEFTDNGRFCRIVHQSGMIVAELLCNDSNLSMRAMAAYDKFGMKTGIPEKFREPQNPYIGYVEEIEDVSEIKEEIEELEKFIPIMHEYSEEMLNQKEEN